MSELASYELAEAVATITMDDGKANLITEAMVQAVHAALDRAQEDKAVVVLTGSRKMFSAGFDLSAFTQGAAHASRVLIGGAELAERLLSFPTPVVIACNGHAIAMGGFLLLSGDVRIGAAGPAKFQLNEVAIGLTMPGFGIEIARQRMPPAHFNQAVITAQPYSTETAVEAGFLDQVVPAQELLSHARDTAIALSKLNMPAHIGTKLAARASALKALRATIENELTVEALGVQLGAA